MPSAAADFAWTPEGLLKNAVLVWDESGRLTEVRKRLPRERAAHDLPGRLLLPGFVNVHSHAFQRLLRGRSSRAPLDAHAADFWSWRAVMYEALAKLDGEALEAVAAQTFLEMTLSGITCVGEFHYLHHDPEGRRYDDRAALARSLARAAQMVGLRLVLLDAAYARAGFRQQPHPLQKRFFFGDLDEFLGHHQAVRALCGSFPRLSVGMALHSVRALEAPWLVELGEAAHRDGEVLHMHLCEQTREVEECLLEHGKKPGELALDLGLARESTTFVHATRCSDEEIAALLATGSQVCLCPSTEHDLGDGLPDSCVLAQSPASICLGSDSNLIIDPFAEMRAVENGERCRRHARVVCAEDGRKHRSVAAPLLAMATFNGARSLGVQTGMLEPDRGADFCAVDLSHPTLNGVAAEDLPEALALCGQPALISEVFVAGEALVEQGRHARQDEISHSYEKAAKELRGRR